MLPAGLILVLFVKYKALRQKEGLYFMTLLAVCDWLSSVKHCYLGIYRLWESVQDADYTISVGLCIGALMWPATVTLVLPQLANIALCLDR